MADDVLKMLGFDNLNYDDLTPAEKESYEVWYNEFERTGGLNIDDVKGYIAKLKESLILEIAKTSYDKREDLFLKARLLNITLLEAFVTSPDRAKKMFEMQAKRNKLGQARR